MLANVAAGHGGTGAALRGRSTQPAPGDSDRSLDALRRASETSYFKGEDALWVKLVVPTDPELPIRPTVMQESIMVSR